MTSTDPGLSFDDDLEKGCVFCELDHKIVMENDLAIAFEDKFPVSKGHILVIPKRHCENYFSLTLSEIEAIHRLLLGLEKQLIDNDKSITGFNIGSNNGRSAGQTIFHCHVHLIPRREGDIINPRGGIRNILREAGNNLPTWPQVKG